MTRTKPVILVVDPDKSLVENIRFNLSGEFEVKISDAGSKAIELASSFKPDAVVASTEIPNIGAAKFVDLIRQINPVAGLVFIFTSSMGEVEADLVNSFTNLRFLNKPIKFPILLKSIRDVLDASREETGKSIRIIQLEALTSRLKKDFERYYPVNELSSQGGGLKLIMERVKHAAGSDSPVLISGEPGTGKELVARAIHEAGQRSEGPFIRFSVGQAYTRINVEEQLLKKESPTSAWSLAARGTLYIMEVSSVPATSQARLNSALSEREDTAPRLIASTTHDPLELDTRRLLRDDLLKKLGVFQISLPPLRARRSDIPDLARYFMESFAAELGKDVASIEEAALEKLVAYPWPGNVRELKNVIERAVLLSSASKISSRLIDAASGIIPVARADLEQIPAQAYNTNTGSTSDLSGMLSEIERNELIDALKKAHSNRSKAAKLLGINRSTLYYRMKKLNIIG